jgi:hypothetical protein
MHSYDVRLGRRGGLEGEGRANNCLLSSVFMIVDAGLPSDKHVVIARVWIEPVKCVP